MSVRLRILFVCEHSCACVRSRKHFEREGCQLLIAANAEKAARALLSNSFLDAVLIHQDNLLRGSTTASGLKLIRPNIPVLLLTATWPSTGALPRGVDALCYATTLNRRVAHDVLRFIRRLLMEASLQLIEAGLKNQFLPRGSGYLN
jgi:hypothetical protein